MQILLENGNDNEERIKLMGLDKRKNILLKDDFNIDPLYPKNSPLSIEIKTTLPYVEDDVMLDKRQSVYYSFEYVLKKLLDNDKFIDEYLKKTHVQLEYVTKNRLSTALNSTNETTSGIKIYNAYLSNHIAEYHTSSYSLQDVAENFIRSDLSNFDENGARERFQIRYPEQQHLSSSTNIQLSNDFVVNIEFSEDARRPTNYVNAAVCNKMTNGQFRSSLDFGTEILTQIPSLTSMTYIYKEWLSGMKELYVHLPTTFTMYNENENAALSDYWKSERINENTTIIQLKINRRHFKWNHIYQAYICGQSLPLQIHNNNDYAYFSDVILPSVLKTMCVQPNESNNSVNCIYDENTSMYTLYFVCYGTDEQAIRIFGD